MPKRARRRRAACSITCVHPLEFRRQPDLLAHSGAADRGAAVLAGGEARRGRAAATPTPSIAASSRCWPSGRRSRCSSFSLITGRGTQSMWGFPLWLFLGLWIVVFAPAALDRARLAHLGAHGRRCSSIFVAAFLADYLVLPSFDHRYRAAFFPGDACRRRSRSASRRRPGKSPLTSSARCGMAATSRIIRSGARSRAC